MWQLGPGLPALCNTQCSNMVNIGICRSILFAINTVQTLAWLPPLTTTSDAHTAHTARRVCFWCTINSYHYSIITRVLTQCFSEHWTCRPQRDHQCVTSSTAASPDPPPVHSSVSDKCSVSCATPVPAALISYHATMIINLEMCGCCN